jgi:predicted MPP superfamily phosphohydrolase
MKIFAVSDVHLEYPGTCIFDKAIKHIRSDADVLVVCGDLGWPSKPHFNAFFREMVKHYLHVIFVPGNHEYYHTVSMDESDTFMETICANHGVHFLQNDSIEIEGVKFIGSTLWTALRTTDHSNVPDTMRLRMNDFRYIFDLTQQKWKDLHTTAITYIDKELRETPDDMPCVVLTHHAPVFAGIHPMFEHDGTNGCFASNLSVLIKAHDNLHTWVFGHTHSPTDIMIHNTHVRSNPVRGTQGKLLWDKDFKEHVFEIKV